jgi:hypothetical protein
MIRRFALTPFFTLPFLLPACADDRPPVESLALEARGGLPGGGPGFDPAGETGDNHCVVDGIDLNAALGISEAILIIGLCEDVSVGEFYVPFATWFTNQEGGAEDTPVVYPAGYTPSAAGPIDDFLSKVVAMRYVVGDKTYVVPGAGSAVQTTVGTLWGDGFFPESWSSFPAVVFAPRLPPLRPGSHEIDVFIELAERHCDGLGDDDLWNCIPAGENYWFTQPVHVAPRRAP